MKRPRLAIVGGAPASGKTGLAEKIAAAVELPLLAKDRFKEILFDTLGVPDLPASRRYGLASMRLLYGAAGWLLDARIGAVLESNFVRGLSEEDLRPLVARSEAVLVHCWTTREEVVARFERRASSGEWHPGHRDEERIEAARRSAEPVFDWRAFELPLELGVPVLRVETTDGYDPPLEAVVEWVRSGGAVGPE